MPTDSQLITAHTNSQYNGVRNLECIQAVEEEKINTYGDNMYDEISRARIQS